MFYCDLRFLLVQLRKQPKALFHRLFFVVASLSAKQGNVRTGVSHVLHEVSVEKSTGVRGPPPPRTLVEALDRGESEAPVLFH